MDNLRQAYKTSVKNLNEAFELSIDGINKAYEDAVKELQTKDQVLQEREQTHNDEIQRFEQEKVTTLFNINPTKGKNRQCYDIRPNRRFKCRWSSLLNKSRHFTKIQRFDVRSDV